MRYDLDFPERSRRVRKTTRISSRSSDWLRAREKKKAVILYVSRKRVSDNNSSLSSDRLDANRLTSGVSERWDTRGFAWRICEER